MSVFRVAAAALFAGPINVSVGAQANNNGGVGQTVVLSRFQITQGATSLLDDQFPNDASLDTALWQVAAVDAASIVLASPDAIFWLGWTLPAAGFVLQATPDLTNPNWSDSTLTSTAYGSTRRILVHSSETPGPSKAFFRLIQRP